MPTGYPLTAEARRLASLCPLCGGTKWRGSTCCVRCYHAALAARDQRGARNPAWRGKAEGPSPRTAKDRGRGRARGFFTALGTCVECGAAPAVERHHRDGDTFNNAPQNVAAVCRRCHMLLDGRLATFMAQARRSKKKNLPPVACLGCNQTRPRYARGLCSVCYQRLRRALGGSMQYFSAGTTGAALLTAPVALTAHAH